MDVSKRKRYLTSCCRSYLWRHEFSLSVFCISSSSLFTCPLRWEKHIMLHDSILFSIYSLHVKQTQHQQHNLWDSYLIHAFFSINNKKRENASIDIIYARWNMTIKIMEIREILCDLLNASYFVYLTSYFFSLWQLCSIIHTIHHPVAQLLSSRCSIINYFLTHNICTKK